MSGTQEEPEEDDAYNRGWKYALQGHDPTLPDDKDYMEGYEDGLVVLGDEED